MAAMEGLTRVQKDSLANLQKGDLVIIHNPHYVAPPEESGWERLPRDYTGHINEPIDYSHHPDAGAAIGDPGPDGYVSEDSNYVNPDRTRSPWDESLEERQERVRETELRLVRAVVEERRAETMLRAAQDHVRRTHLDLTYLRQAADEGDDSEDAVEALSTTHANIADTAIDAMARDDAMNSVMMDFVSRSIQWRHEAQAPNQGEQATRESEAYEPGGGDGDAEPGDEGDDDRARASFQVEQATHESETDEPDGGDGDAEPGDKGDEDQIMTNNSRDTDNSQPFSAKPSHMFVVSSIARNGTGEVMNLKLRLLDYEKFPNEARNEHSWQIYGTECVYHSPLEIIAVSVLAQSRIASIKDILDHNTFEVFTRPNADKAIDVFGYQGQCPFACDEGWHHDSDEIEGTIVNYRIPVTYGRVLCPSCMGIDLVKEHLGLRRQVETPGLADIGTLTEFYGRVNQRRTELEYSIWEFDEREWGYHFDDMLSDQGEDDAGSDDDEEFEEWIEAQDPNGNIVNNPASEVTIAALPRKTYAEVKPADKDDEGPCAICREDMEDDKQVVVLPCKHFFCATGCVEQWLRQFSTCPTCRAEVREYELPEHENTYEIRNALDIVGAVSSMLALIQPIAGNTDPVNTEVPKRYEAEIQEALQALSQAILGTRRISSPSPFDVIWADAVRASPDLHTLFPLHIGQVWFEINRGTRAGGVSLRDSDNRSRRFPPLEINVLAGQATRRLYESIRRTHLNELIVQAHHDSAVAEERLRGMMNSDHVNAAARSQIAQLLATTTEVDNATTEQANDAQDDDEEDEDSVEGSEGDESEEEDEEDEDSGEESEGDEQDEEDEEDEQSDNEGDAEEDGQLHTPENIVMGATSEENVSRSPLNDDACELLVLASAIESKRAHYGHALDRGDFDRAAAGAPLQPDAMFPDLADENKFNQILALLRCSSEVLFAVEELSATHAKYGRDTGHNSELLLTREALHNAQALAEDQSDVLKLHSRSLDEIRLRTTDPVKTAHDQVRRLECFLEVMFAPAARGNDVAWHTGIDDPRDDIPHAELAGLAAELSTLYDIAGLAQQALSRFSTSLQEPTPDRDEDEDSSNLSDEDKNEFVNAHVYLAAIHSYLDMDSLDTGRKGPGEGIPVTEAVQTIDALVKARGDLSHAEFNGASRSVKHVLLSSVIDEPESLQQRFRRAVVGSWIGWNFAHTTSMEGAVERERRLTTDEIDELALRAIEKLYAMVWEEQAESEPSWAAVENRNGAYEGDGSWAARFGSGRAVGQ